MEQAILHLAHVAAWTFLIIFVLALIGVIAIISWIAALFRRTEDAVGGGVARVEGAIHHHDETP